MRQDFAENFASNFLILCLNLFIDWSLIERWPTISPFVIPGDAENCLLYFRVRLIQLDYLLHSVLFCDFEPSSYAKGFNDQ